LALWLLASCNDTLVAGGSGTEAGNAITVVALAPDGKPLAGARVEIRPSVSTDTAAYRGTTGSDGSATLKIPVGTWSVLVRKDALAYRTFSVNSRTVSDTLRPTTAISGIVEGGAGNRIAALGLGESSICDANGYFRFEDLPPGALPLTISGTNRTVNSDVNLLPGTSALTLVDTGSLPTHLTTLPSDSLVPWSNRAAPATLPRPALGDSGNFSVAVRLRREDSTKAMWAIEWTDSASRGIRIGWHGRDTMALSLDGKTYDIAGIPLGSGTQQVGLSWDGHRISVLLGQDSIATLTSSTFDQRSTWKTPVFGSMGTSKVEWVAFKRGNLVYDWLRRLSQM